MAHAIGFSGPLDFGVDDLIRTVGSNNGMRFTFHALLETWLGSYVDAAALVIPVGCLVNGLELGKNKIHCPKTLGICPL